MANNEEVQHLGQDHYPPRILAVSTRAVRDNLVKDVDNLREKIRKRVDIENVIFIATNEASDIASTLECLSKTLRVLASIPLSAEDTP